MKILALSLTALAMACLLSARYQTATDLTAKRLPPDNKCDLYVT